MKIYSQSPIKFRALQEYSRNENSAKKDTTTRNSSYPFPAVYPTTYSINTRKLAESGSFLDYTTRPTMKDLELIKKENPAVLVRAYKAIERNIEKAFFETSPKLTAQCAYALKDLLDFTQDGKYKIVSIGTSPEPIAFALENLGCEVVYLPISGVGAVKEEKSTDKLLKKYPNLQTAMEYLKYKKINATSNDKIILLDYVSTGLTMELLKKLIIENNGVKRDKVETWNLEEKLNVAKILQERVRGNYDFYNIEDRFRLHNDLGQQRVEAYSKTPHFNACAKQASDVGNRFEFFENYANPTAAAYQFCVLNELQKMKK